MTRLVPFSPLRRAFPTKLKRRPRCADMVAFPDPRRRHPFQMHDMILGQPAFIAEALRRTSATDLSSFVGRPRRFVLTGCGTSFHAATYGARLFQEVMPSVPVLAIHAYDLAYGSSVSANATVLGVSHSGSTPTTNRALRRARRRGCRSLAMCGLPNSPMERVADHTLVIGSTHDRSWANTMSYTTQLAALAGLASRSKSHVGPSMEPALRGIARSLENTLACESRVRRLATQIARRARITFLGSDLDEITALEAALKIRETCSLPASGYHPEQFLHGPYLSIDDRESIVMLRSRDDGPRSAAISRALKASGASVATIGESARAQIRLPAVPRILRPILSIVPMQFLAYYAALARHANPDIMRTDIPRLRAGVEALFH